MTTHIEPGPAAVLDLADLDRTQLAVAGGKGAHLGELMRVEGIRVPPGYCVTTAAFRRVLASSPSIGEQLDRLASLPAQQPDRRNALAAGIRRTIEEAPLPDDLAAAITRPLARLGAQAAYAVRSSATAEDLPAASFAGQQDSYLNVVGPAAVLALVRRCWASLFTERAVSYRLRQGIDHRDVEMAVVVQRMVFPRAAGVLFTADPRSGHRKTTYIEATFGLGDALVSGLVTPDVYIVRASVVVGRTIAAKRLATRPSPRGGTLEEAREPVHGARPVLDDAEALLLARVGRSVEAHFGCPQDVEWCIGGDGIEIVQSRPITTLFPVPAAADQANRVYISVGHQQMMTDPLKPLGLSIWQLTAARPMAEAGGRLFVDVTPMLISTASRAGLMALVGRSDPLIADALQTLLDRGDVVAAEGDEHTAAPPAPILPSSSSLECDPSIVPALVARSEASVAAAERGIREHTGPALLDFIQDDLQELKRVLFDTQSHQAIMAGIEAAWWLNDHLEAWLGEKNAADALTQSVPHNVTSEMGLALLEVADAIRPHADVVAFLRQTTSDAFLDELQQFPGGAQARAALQAWLDRFGMRGVGEIDITRPRWREQPRTLLPLLLNHVDNFEPGAAGQRFDEGLRHAARAERDLLARLAALPDGPQKVEAVRRMIARVRTFMGYREYPKYAQVSRYFIYKRALLEEAARLVQAGRLGAEDDIFFLRFEELRDLVNGTPADHALIRQRRNDFRAYQKLTPPRVLTSDGEALTGAYRRTDVPAGALPGLPVSAGIVEGRARVVLDVREAHLQPGDILVTAFTDPSWTPLFVGIAGLVTEVGGLMTHGSVIAREYGLPAVVGVADATRTIRDGQRIRLDGTEGIIEFLSDPSTT